MRIKNVIKQIKRIFAFELIVIQVVCLISCKSSPSSSKDNSICYVSTGTGSNREIDLSNLYSPSAIVMELDSNKIIAANNSNEHVSPASLTKIMTAIVALENIKDLNTKIYINKDMFTSLYEEDASRAGFLPGENAIAEDLLYGVLLPSGAECCIALAEYIAGSEENYVKMMNDKAQELGMSNTHFTNTTGLTADGHYSTVADIAILLNYALDNQEFYKIFTSSSHNTTPTDMHPNGFTFYSTMFDRIDGTEVSGGRILGGKTGYTDKAGLCLGSLAIINGSRYICVTAGAHGNHSTTQYNILDAKEVYNFIGMNK